MFRRDPFTPTVKEGMRGISQWTGLCHATIENAVAELIDVKLITVKRDKDNRDTNTYTPSSPGSLVFLDQNTKVRCATLSTPTCCP